MRGRSAADVDVPAELDDASLPRALRTFHSLPPGDPARTEVRDRLLGYYQARGEDLVASGDYEALVDHLGRMAALYTPQEIGEGQVGPELESVARKVVALGRERSDEARVLAALRLLAASPAGTDDDQRRYEQVARWGREARATLDGAIDEGRRLSELWEAHAELSPAPEVLDFTAGLYLDLRARLVALLRAGPEALGDRGSFRELRLAPLLLQQLVPRTAAVYLRQGDVVGAASRLDTVEDLASDDLELLRELQDARRGGGEGADALLRLEGYYREGAPPVALGICRYGRQQHPEDPRFPVCLARVATLTGDHGEATAWYAEAIRMAPERRRVYDEALESLSELIAEGLFDDDPSVARGIAAEAQTILEQRIERFPDTPPAVSPAELDRTMGLLEMNAGNADAAREHLERSLAAEESTTTLRQLGLLERRLGRPEEAARLLRRALDRTPGTGVEGQLERAGLLEQLGDAFADAGNAAQAERMYRQAIDQLESLEGLGGEMPGGLAALVNLRRGVMLDHLNREEASIAAFEAALDASPGSREPYAQILSHLVVGTPNLPFAERVFRRAQRQLTLEPEWKVYFGLWVGAIAARTERSPSPDVAVVLEEASESPDWFGRLAKFGIGELPYTELLDEANGVGQRTEAYFYEGTRLLGAGDADGAAALFRQVLDARMVNFYEFAMAQALLQEPPETASSTPGAGSRAARRPDGAR
jgi:tetratricopeptide (TPR) repeat protein